MERTVKAKNGDSRTGRGAGRVALITGCSTGIGRDLAQAMSVEGYRVVATARRVETLEEVNAAMRLSLDVSSESSAKAAVERIKEVYGRIDILVNNAGYAVVGAIEELREAELKAMFEVNLFGALRMIRLVAPLMRERGSGAIVNISSIAGRISLGLNGAYSATKYALEAASCALRMELRPFGIDVIVVGPGSIGTRFDATVTALSRRMTENPLSPYRGMYLGSEKAKTGMRSGEPGPEAVSSVVLKALAKRKPRDRYHAGVTLLTRIFMGLGEVTRHRLLEKAFFGN